ncbi:hypothetical protein BDR07DRAFT_1389076 [Suillus spraguei]|nr:hypothetical protein BDR07DRAFT_1389076 [Suillus spraguei]
MRQWGASRSMNAMAWTGSQTITYLHTIRVLGIALSQGVALSTVIGPQRTTVETPTALAQRGKGSHASIFNLILLGYWNASSSTVKLGSSLSIHLVSLFLIYHH